MKDTTGTAAPDTTQSRVPRRAYGPKDPLGVIMRQQDRVMVTSVGYGARHIDQQQVGVVVGFPREVKENSRVQRVTVRFPGGETRRIDPFCLCVMRRDGETGFEGNLR